MADGEVNVRVNAEGVGEAAQEFEEATGDGGGGLPGISTPDGDTGGGGGMMGQLMSSIGSMSGTMMGVLGALGLIVGLLATLKPVQKMIEGLFKILQAFVAPLAVMLMRLLSPVLGFLMRLLPIWMDFLSDPEGMIENAMRWLEGELMAMAAMITGGLGDKLETLLPGWWPWAGGGNNGDRPETDGREFETPTGGSFFTGVNPGEMQDDNATGRFGSDATGGRGSDTNINIFGGLETFIDRITRDGTVNGRFG